ncbi:hypothetical protein Vadar_015500 [Vaccinium darrowii]|uniref:Uncharacterized protein n=1 Tax=Vaccinium darrowii TaxID=229202 RepID=A0ACB7ZBR7_9ERIC|nr:hypothetical protein Vadar_015500 [Vaccinium darrowii]
MSVISALLLFLLFVSFPSCYARHIGAIGRMEPEKNSFLPFENDETKSRGAGDGEGTRKQISTVIKDVDHKTLGNSSLKAKNKKGQQRVMKTSSSGALKAESLISHDVSWHLPHKKRGTEDQPGYNLVDYAPPKTHPGVHN